MGKMKDIRNNFIKMRGGKLIYIESVILAFVVFFIMIIVKDTSPYAALVAAFILGFVFPILIGVFKTLAWFAAILFSLVWAFLFFLIVETIASGAGLLAGIVFFIVSFIVHKNYSGLSLQVINRKNREPQSLQIEDISLHEDISFCPKCGRRIKTSDGQCDVCDR